MSWKKCAESKKSLYSVMAFVIGLPVAQIILFCLAIGHDPTGLPIAVSNHELSASLLAQQDCPTYEGCNYTMLSCRYLEYLKNRSVVVVSSSAYAFSICIIMSFVLADTFRDRRGGLRDCPAGTSVGRADLLA